jgi:hypothetical protein
MCKRLYCHVTVRLLTCFESMNYFIAHFETVRDCSLEFTLTHTHAHTCECPRSLVYCRCMVVASNGGRSPSCGFPNGPRPQLPASNSDSSQLPYPSSDLGSYIRTELLTLFQFVFYKCLWMCTVSLSHSYNANYMKYRRLALFLSLSV